MASASHAQTQFAGCILLIAACTVSELRSPLALCCLSLPYITYSMLLVFLGVFESLERNKQFNKCRNFTSQRKLWYKCTVALASRKEFELEVDRLFNTHVRSRIHPLVASLYGLALGKANTNASPLLSPRNALMLMPN